MAFFLHFFAALCLVKPLLSTNQVNRLSVQRNRFYQSSQFLKQLPIRLNLSLLMKRLT
jgi:hypothetical protein